MKFKPVLLLAAFLLCTASAFAQGKIRFDWVESSWWDGEKWHPPGAPIFQASLTLDASLVYPNSVFWPGSGDPDVPPACATGLTVTSPDQSWPDGALWANQCPPGDPFYSHFNEAGWLDLYVSGVRLWVRSDIIGESDTSGKTLYISTGSWRETIVPEPSTAAVLGLGLLALYMKRAANSSSL